MVRFGHRPPARCKHQSHRQDRLQYTAPLASAQCRYRKEVKNKNTRKVIKKKKKISHRYFRSVAWELIPLFGPWSRRGLNPIKPVYDPDRPDGRLNLTASAFNQQVNIPAVLVAGATATQNSPFSSLTVVVNIASTHCAYPRMDGQAELAWVAGYVYSETVYLPEGSHPSHY